MQLYDALSVPSSYQAMWTSPSNAAFLTLVNGLIQSIRLPCSVQKRSGSTSDCW